MSLGSSFAKFSDIRSLIEYQATIRGDQVFILDPETGQTITFKQLLDFVKTVATSIHSRGIIPGESVAYAMTNGAECSITVLGIMFGGYRATSLNLVSGAFTLGYVLEHSETRLIITQPLHDGLLDQALSENAIKPPRVYADQLVGNSGNEKSKEPGKVINGTSDGLLMYTSGTTGKPKGVLLSHENLLVGGLNTTTAHELTAKDRALCVLPLYHINGMCVTLMGPLISGGSVVMPSRFSTSSFWQQIEANKCTWFSVVPTQISYLLHDKSENETDLKSLRFGRSASAPLSPDVQNAFEKRFQIPIVETMGLTETAAQILSNPLPPGKRKSGSPGKPVGNEVIIADQNQNELPPGIEGELLVRGKNVLRAYLNNQEATNSSLTQDGWLRTGDLGRMDEDGYFFITGRLKELIIKGGENIAPREIDEALYAHSDVIEAAAFASPCENYGQTVEAAVKLSQNSIVTEKELVDFCRQRLGPVKTPDKIHFLDDLPKGASGKIQRAKIADILQSLETT